MERKTSEDKSTVTSHSHSPTKDSDYRSTVTGSDVSTIEESPYLNYPDGGLKAWTIVFGAMCSCFATFGFVNSWGIFQDYYQRTILKDSSPSNIAWIGSFQYSLIFFPALIFGRLFDLGYFRVVLLASSATLVGSTFLVAQCTRYWHFLLCQGFAIGLASSGVVVTAPTLVLQWFCERRGLALGLLAVGSSTGGTVIPIAVRKLLPILGFQWTIRIIGFALTFLLVISNLVLKRRLPPKNVPGGLFNLSAFRNPLYTLYCISGMVTYLGFYTVLTYISVTAMKIGLGEDFAFYLVSISNAGSLCGRYAAGILADKIGPLYVIIPFNITTAVLTWIWPYCNDLSSLTATAVIYGFFSGGYSSLIAHPLVELGQPEDLGRRTGMFFSLVSLGALSGPPISGAISSTHESFHSVGWYAGTMILVGVIFQVLIKFIMVYQCEKR